MEIKKIILWMVLLSMGMCFFVFSQNEDSKQEVLLTLDFKDADIRDVIRGLARISGENIVISPQVKGKVTMSLQGVNWQDALEMIASTYGLAVEYRKNYIKVITLREWRQMGDAQPLKIKVISLKLADATMIKDIIRQFLSPRGKLEVDTSTNSLVIKDTVSQVEKIEELIKELDTRAPQIFIEAMVVDFKSSKTRELGIKWSVLKETTSGVKVDLSSAAALIVRYGKSILDKKDLEMLITMFEEEGEAEILANPRVLTLDNKEAEINLVNKVPYRVTEFRDETQITSTKFEEVGVKLKVKPHITGELIVSGISLVQSFLVGFRDGQPEIEERSADLNLAVKSGETIVIGGLKKEAEAETITKVPLLGDLPLIGMLFRRKVTQEADSELLLFLTPYIVTRPSMSIEEKQKLKKFRGIRYLRVKEELSNKDLLPLKPPQE